MKLMRNGIENGCTPLGWSNDSKISEGCRHLRALKTHKIKLRLRGQASLIIHIQKCAE